MSPAAFCCDSATSAPAPPVLDPADEADEEDGCVEPLVTAPVVAVAVADEEDEPPQPAASAASARPAGAMQIRVEAMDASCPQGPENLLTPHGGRRRDPISCDRPSVARDAGRRPRG